MIFSTKNREPLLVGDAAARLYAYIGGICRNSGNVLTAAGGMPDHVHLLVALGKQSCVADVVRDIKSNSSGWIHKEFSSLRGFAWQTGYGAFGASHSSVGEVTRYIAVQHEHHRVRQFQEEFRLSLKRHEIKYDERYVWD
jgi:REP element-mobilizing transposase RayT